MPLDQQSIEKLCYLARLEITSGEIADVAAKLANIVALVDQLESADTAQVPPMAHPLSRPQRLRDDVVTEHDQRQLYQRNAPLVEHGLYLVPRVIE